MDSSAVPQIPIIDFSDENLKPGTDIWFSTSKIVRSALEGNGCFYAMSKNIYVELCNSVFALMKELFDLPFETKMQNISDKPGHGYYEQRPMISVHESLEIYLDGPSNKEKEIQKFANMMWPTGYDLFFTETVNLYAKLLIEMDQTAKRLLFDAYGLNKTCCDSMLESTSYMFRSFKYLVPHNKENNLGLHAHTDASYLTILHHINNVTGLKVKLKTGDWVGTDPSPNMFLFLAGDALKVWSNDRILPCEHKVIVREDKERYSMGLFSCTNKMVQTQEELVDEDHPIKYRAYDHLEYVIFCTKLPSQEEKSNFFLL